MSPMFHHVTRAKHLGGHRVRLRFHDGVEGDVDLGPFLEGPVFEPLRDPAYFAGFEVDDTLVWPNGADFAPEFLRERIQRTTPDKVTSGSGGEEASWKEPAPDEPRGPQEVSRFLGLRVSMGVQDTEPSTLVVEVDSNRVEMDVETGSIRGHLASRAARYLDEWRCMHRDELRRNVERLERGEAALAIEPLE